jgi:hypothetical protein
MPSFVTAVSQDQNFAHATAVCSSPFSQLGVAAVVIGRETSSAMALLAPPINRLTTPVRVRVCTLARLHVETRYTLYMRRDHAIDA